MRAFQVFCVALAASSAYGQIAYGFAPSAHVVSTGGSYGYAAPVAYSAGYGSAYSTAVAAPVTSVAHVAQPVNVGVVAHAPAAATVRTHEVHTASGQQHIHIDDVQSGDQVIRVHEGPQAPPSIAQVHVPGEQHHVRVVNHGSGPAIVQRTVHRQPTQVVDLQKPGRPGINIVQVQKDPNPAPSVEIIEAGGNSHHVYQANSGIASVGIAQSYAAPIGVAHSYAAPVAVGHSHIVHAPASVITGHSYGYGYQGYPFGIKK